MILKISNIINLGFVVSFSASAVTRVAEVVTVVVAVDPGGSGVLCSNIALIYGHVSVFLSVIKGFLKKIYFFSKYATGPLLSI